MGIFLKKYSWILYLVLIFFGTYFVAKTVSTLLASKIRVSKRIEVEPSSASGANTKRNVSFEDYRVILDRNIFDSRNIEVAAEPTAAPEELNLEGPAVKTALPIKLVGTVSVGDGTDRRSSATISGGSAKGEETYTVGDEKQFSPGVQITKILPDRVEFINNRRLEFVGIETFGGGVSTSQPISSLEKAPPPPTSGGGGGVQDLGQNKYVVDRAEIENAMTNVDELFTQIRAVPQMQGGKSTGLKLLSIRSGSLFAKLGLKRNDVLERINGQPVDMRRGLEIFTQLKDSESISIDLVRDGQKTTLDYNIQ